MGLTTYGMAAVVEIAAGVALAMTFLPVHELGHAMMLWILTGFWPHFGIFAVEPAAPIPSRSAALLILGAGDVAVVMWWSALFVVTRRRVAWRWAIVGPTFVLLVTLAGWLVSAVLFPFGHAELGNSDAAKFLATLDLKPWVASALVGVTTLAIAGGVVSLVWGYFAAEASSRT